MQAHDSDPAPGQVLLDPHEPLPVSLPDALLARPVTGRRLEGGTLADQLGPRPDALIFLRHFG